MKVSRRLFLQRTLGTAAACGLAQLSAANNTRTEFITDTHAYLGNWPHRRLVSDDPIALMAELRRNRVTQAWVGSFDGLFHKDVAAVNQRLAETCTQVGNGMLIPFGTINPTLPDWEEDLRRCHETFHMPGIRLHPNYHGYTLDDPRFARVLKLAAAGGLIVQLVAWMSADRHFLLNPHVAQVDLKPLAEKIAAFPRLKLVLANGYRVTDDDGKHMLNPQKPIYFDFARADKATDVRLLIEAASADRVVFGSGMPLHDIEPAVARMKRVQINDRQLQAIAVKNANRLVVANRIP